MRLSHRRKVASKNCPADPRRQQLITWQRRRAFRRALVNQIHLQMEYLALAHFTALSIAVFAGYCRQQRSMSSAPHKLSLMQRIKNRIAGWYGSLQACLD